MDGSVSGDGVPAGEGAPEARATAGERAPWAVQAADEPFAYLTTTGRVSGRPHRIEIWFVLDGQRVLLMSGGRDRSDWVKNVMADPRVTIEIAGMRRSGRAAVVAEDSVDDALARRLLVEKYQRRDELRDWRLRSLPIVIEVD